VRQRTAAADGIAVLLAVGTAYVVRFDVPEISNLGDLGIGQLYALLSIGLFVGWLVALRMADVLDLKLLGAGPQEYTRVSNATLAFFGVVAIVAYLVKYDLARGYVAIALPLGIVLLCLERFILRRILIREREQGRHLSTALVVGGRDTVAHLISELRRTPQAGFDVVAACVPGAGVGSEDRVNGIPVVGSVSDVAEFAGRNEIDAIVVTGSDVVTPPVLKRIAWDLEPYGTDLVLAPALTDVAGPRIHTRPVAGVPLLHVEAPGYSGPHQTMKRAFDVIGSVVLIAILLLPLAITAAAVKVTSRGPVLFRQERIGIGGRPFTIYKFRSMAIDAESRLEEVLGQRSPGVFYKPKSDPRVTAVGRFIRRFSVDELPQLFNVLGGSMSLVGPRPQVRLEVEQYDNEVGRRLLVKPGMTGLWQVSGRNDLTLEESVRLDLFYVENWSMASDLVILARTMGTVLRQRGAY
jgi:exopolysaccharide biosynthesis polyprenyl glycosylphosphotransferase